MQLSREEGMGGQASLEALSKSLERMTRREAHVNMGACTPCLRVNDNWIFLQGIWGLQDSVTESSSSMIGSDHRFGNSAVSLCTLL